MKKILITTLLSIVSYYSIGQKEQIISGGNSISSMVCSSGEGYVWGGNTSLTTKGLLGTGDSFSDFIASPQKVNLPDGKKFAQINCGSGSHFIATDCDKWAWSWGANDLGQTGNGQSGINAIVTSPTRVVVSSSSNLAGTKWGIGGFLTNVDVVYAGSTSSFAILDDGRLVSWGANGNVESSPYSYAPVYGQLGHGTASANGLIQNILTPMFVRTADGLPLTGVKNIFVAENVSYALVDLDGDGIGTVYSWGNGSEGKLGRNALGTANPSSPVTVMDPFARPVMYENGTQMNNIKEISAGDVFGMALDINGYIWTWGNGGWNKATGNSTSNLVNSAPGRVLKGTTTGASNDGTYLLASSISGGQGFGMAISVDNKPVAWGGDAVSCQAGGITGTGATTYGISPAYIQYNSTGLVHNNVVFINRGDTWGYYGLDNGDVYSWGCNTYGQLGLGNTNSQTRAVKFTPPSGCDFKDPSPKVYSKTKDKIVCPGFSEVLTFDVNIPTTKYSSYAVKLFKNGQLVKTEMLKESSKSITVTEIATYKVELIDTINVLCNSKGNNMASVKLSYLPNNTTIPSNLTYCNDSTAVWLKTTENAQKPLFNWYDKADSGNKLASSYGNDTVGVKLNSVLAGNLGLKKVYVEQITENTATLLPKTAQCSTYFDITSQKDKSNLVFSVEKPTRLLSMNVLVGADIFSSNQSVSMKYKISIKNSVLDYNGRQSVGSVLIDTSVYTYEIKNSTQQSKSQVATFNFNTVLQPGTYVIIMESFANVSGALFGVYSCQETANTQLIGNTMKHLGYIDYNNFINKSNNLFYNIKFGVDRKVCSRTEVAIKYECPCIINIPDQAFKTCLLNNPAINLNKDANINCGEAANFTGTIVCGQIGIESLAGIENFTSLTGLNVFRNNIATMDLSKNIELKYLETYSNPLLSIDLSKNKKLTTLSVTQNSLTSIDLKNNLALDTVRVSDNAIESLDLSLNSQLNYLNCHGNNLKTLNVANGNNTAFVVFYATNNPNLTCVQVDNKDFSTSNWSEIDPASVFSENCANVSGLSSIHSTAVLYPNPFSDFTYVGLDEAFDYTIIDSQGKVVEQGTGNGATKVGQDLSSGHFILKINIENEVRTHSIYKVR